MRTQLHHLVSEAAVTRGDAPAVTVKDTTRTYAQLWAETVAVGAGLRRLGLNTEDRVAVYLDKRVETVTAIFGASAAGGVFVPVNPLLRARQVAFILADCDVKVLVTSPERLAMLKTELADCKALEHVVVIGEKPEVEAHYRVSTWGDLIAGPEQPPVDGIDLSMAAILYTSGSTGTPKGVVLSHRNLIVGAESVSGYIGNTPDDVIVALLPLSFDAGFSQLTTAFSVGAHVVLVNYLTPADVLNQCAKHGVTGLTCVPPLWIQLADLTWPAETAGRIRYFANTGGRMPRSTLDKLRAHFTNAKPFLMYGLTEAFRSTYLDPAEVDRRPDSIGKAIPDAEILVVRDDGSICDPHEPGELVHRGALVSLGYWNDPERTAERFRPAPGRPAGVMVTELAVFSGDVVKRDEEGFLYFVSRKDEMIKTSGYRVSPTEIEEVVYETGLVRDAVALGVDDERLGQHIVVIVAGSKEGGTVDAGVLLKDLRKRLPLYMVPKRVVVKDEIPRSPNGKFDRTLLRQELAT
ncbi:acyl-CoA ligase (AMP-forming), exosortase A system-associated [Virgisporangium aurantiacum]|uniref:Acyl-CoA ligase (AMP-forming), exosortase A system-associated n=1 Tax=Virgisporangium aurantiacum TaxID=175570 RepID=A0A8J3ZDZ5_9ACTN|nr:acyl-CoA ligase (AMP-forming), exosortase A system-associated [Virgisporangium aurantiacum]GIJ59871.1 acyl-CoA ligase (AMP-forming), exosortase A system-associated [Virgisporangium aurantiacum]